MLLNKNILAIGIVFLFILSVLTPITFGYNVKISDAIEQPSTLSRGKTLYVGGSGDGNYTKIQDAIDNASKGDTVFVYDDSSPYYENIHVKSSINLVGEDRDTTIVDGGGVDDVFNVSAEYVSITGFSIQNSGISSYDAGIEIHSQYNTITDNTILNNEFGVLLEDSNSNTIVDNIISNNELSLILGLYSSNNTITDNTISNNYAGIYLYDSSCNTITDNTILNNRFCVLLVDSNSNTIMGNTITNNEYGIYLEYSNSNTVTGNTISNNMDVGIELYRSNYNTIYHNNFINNGDSAYDECDNIWDDGKYGNYWSDYKEKYPDAKPRLLKPWMWNIPYKIPGRNNQDNCPLIEQWPKSKPRTIQKDIGSYSSYLLRFLEQFPMLRHLLRL